MNLTSYQKSKIRGVVGLVRDLRALNFGLRDQRADAQTQLTKRRERLRDIQAEVNYQNSPGQAYSREARERILREGAERIAACEAAVREAEAHLADIDLRRKELQPDLRAAGQLAESLLACLENGDGSYREDLGGTPKNSTDNMAMVHRGAA